MLTKDSSFVSFIQEPQQNFLFPKGVVEGEKPLKFHLKLQFPFENQAPYLYLTSKNILKVSQKETSVDPK
jgi:hypothetical protein